MKNNTDFISRRATRLRGEARQGLGEVLVTARRELGKTRPEVARAMGYRNVDKGSSQLAMWELGRDVPRGDRPQVLANALGIDVDTLIGFLDLEEYAVDLNDEELLRRRAANSIALAAHEDVFIRHIPLLLDNADKIFDNVLWAGAKVLAAGCSVSMFGGEHYSLRTLLESWHDGDLRLPCPTCGEHIYAYWCSGSPFSNRSSVLGYCPNCRDMQSTQVPNEIGLTRFLQGSRRRQREQTERGELAFTSMEQVVASLGGDVAVFQVRKARSGKTFYWNPGTNFIDNGNGTVLADLNNIGTGVHSDSNWTRLYDRIPSSSNLAIGDLLRLGAGVWQGDTVVLRDRDARQFVVRPGYLEGPDQQVVAWFDGVVPAAVAMFLLENIVGRRR